MGDDFYNRSDMFEMLSANIDKSSADVILFGCTDWNMKTGEMRISRSGYNLSLINEGQNRTDILHYLFSQKKLPGGATISAVSRHLIEEHKIRFHCGIQSEDHDFVLNVFEALQKGVCNGRTILYIPVAERGLHYTFWKYKNDSGY